MSSAPACIRVAGGGLGNIYPFTWIANTRQPVSSRIRLSAMVRSTSEAGAEGGAQDDGDVPGPSPAPRQR